VMMIPIAGSLIALLPTNHSKSEPTNESRRFELCLLLGIAYSASIGGVGTLVGTPPNALLAGALEEIGISISFGRWMMFAVPLVVVYLTLLWWLLYQFVLPKNTHSISIDRSVIDQQLQNLGPMTRAEWTVLSVFLATATLWIIREPLQHWDWLIEICPGIGRLEDASISIGAAIALFLLPVKQTGERALDWQTANRLPWGVLILLGGGMSLAAAMNASGLNTVMADQLQMLQNLPPVLLIAIITGITIFLTEVTSNTATIAALLPVLLGLGAQMACGPVPLMIPATLAASCAFMLPVATAPNAVVFETGRVPMNAMIRYGLWLNLAGIVLIPSLMYLIGCSLFGYPLN
jgi:sodium-dependent dicarboxylate transporter 2/3/5